MAHEDIVMELMEALIIADKHVIGDLMAHKGIWKTGTSSSNNSYKTLITLTELRRLVKCNGYFKIPWCKSEYKEHSRALTKALAEILKLPYDSVIHREKLIQEVKIIPDALVFLKKDGQGRILVIEAVISETEQHLNSKINTWSSWSNATQFLSELFGYRIPHFEFLIVGAEHPESLTLEEL